MLSQQEKAITIFNAIFDTKNFVFQSNIDIGEYQKIYPGMIVLYRCVQYFGTTKLRSSEVRIDISTHERYKSTHERYKVEYRYKYLTTEISSGVFASYRDYDNASEYINQVVDIFNVIMDQFINKSITESELVMFCQNYKLL